jgi:hypothetical protein
MAAAQTQSLTTLFLLLLALLLLLLPARLPHVARNSRRLPGAPPCLSTSQWMPSWRQ